jgi:ABC-type proline/glycine betaine transport system permease subunit
MHLYRIATVTVLAATSLASVIARTSLGEPITLDVSSLQIFVCPIF